MKLTVKIISVFILCICTSLGASLGQAFAAEISSVALSSDAKQTQIVIRVKGTPKIKVFTLKGAPPRVVIDLEASKMSQHKDDGAYAGNGGVAKLRYAVRGKGIRFVADLTPSAQYASHVFDDGVLRIWIKGVTPHKTKTKLRRFSSVAYPRLKPGLERTVSPKLVAATTRLKTIAPPKISVRTFNGIPVPILKPKQARRVKYKPMIVIDPGHGGHDPGAVGVSKVKEETVTLKAALELRKQLLKTGKYRVVLTRATDIYVVHEKRVRIARKAGADLFVSLHADSLGKPNIRGASVYTLADRAKKRGHNLMNTQNWVHDVDLASHSGAVGDILVNLAQREALSKSSQFADILVPQLEKRTILLGNTHREASIYVLIAPDVPAVLLEMGFLSNAKDEKLLNTAKHRTKLMKSVVEATNLYFNAQTALQ